MENIKKLLSWDTVLYADCVEFCPFEPYLSIAICGTYQLCESEASRVGRLSLHSIDPDQIDLTPIQLVDSPGILDVKWCRQKSYNQISLAVANSIGQIVVYTFDPDSVIRQQHVQNICDVDGGRLALSCDWYGGCKIAVSDSKGEVSCLNINNQGPELVGTWKAHDYEAWVASFDRHSDQLIYSGGDDSCFRLWDMRDTTSSVLTNRKAHQMGVTSIETSPVDSNILATGRYFELNHLITRDVHLVDLFSSYDERLLMWDKRHMKNWVSETNLGGGVWKLKWEPVSARHLLAATMHNGFHLVDCLGTSGETSREQLSFEPTIVGSYQEHSSLAYGCDWGRQLSSSGRRTIASCSFYDHSLHVWSWLP